MVENNKNEINEMLNKINNYKPLTKLEEKLENINYPLEEYLKDEEAIECFKNMEKNTKKYFRKEIIKKLIKFITEIPENDDYYMGHKYPYISSEILKIDCDYIQDLFVLTDNEYNIKYNKKIEITNIKNNKIDKNNIDIEEIINNKEFKKIDENNNKILKDKNCIQNIEKNQNITLKISEIIKEIEINKLKFWKNINEKEENKNKEKDNNMNKNEYLDLLLNFVTNETKELNYILCGYFSEVLMALINKYPLQILNYLYSVRKDALEQIVAHSYIKSLSIISSKLLKLHNYLENDLKEISFKYLSIFIKESYYNYLDYRNELFQKIIFSITLNGIKDEQGIIHIHYDIDNLFSLIFDLMEESVIIDIIVYNVYIYSYIFEILKAQLFLEGQEINLYQKNCYILWIKLLTKVFEFINKKHEEFEFIKDSDIEHIMNGTYDPISFNALLLTNMKYIFQNFVDLSSNDKKSNKLGIHNIYILDLIIEIFKYMKEAPNLIDIFLIENNFITKLINYFFKYQMNDIYHQKFIKFFEIFLENNITHPILSKEIFHVLKLDEIIVEFIKEKNDEKNKIVKEQKTYNSKNIFKSGRNISNGIYPYIIQLIYMLQSATGQKIFEEKEQKELNIKKPGEFEFLKDENSTENIKSFILSELIYNKLKSDKWTIMFKNNILPIIKKYEGKLLYNEKTISKKKIETPLNDSLEQYNDIYFWDIKVRISDEIKKKLELKEINKNISHTCINDVNKEKEEENNIENNNIFDEEDELLGIAMSLEKKEKNEENNSSKKLYIKKNKKKINKKGKEKSLSKDSLNNNNNDQSEINKDNKKKKKLKNVSPKKKKLNKKKIIAKLKKPSKSKLNKISLTKKKEENNEKYNDVNYWEIKPESILSENEINNILKDL